MASKITVICAAALCAIAGTNAMTIVTMSDLVSTNVASTVTITAAPSTTQTTSTVMPWSTMDSSQIMDVYSSAASSVNDNCMSSVSSLMVSAQARNEQYYYYANWYVSSNAARTGSTASATAGSVVTVTVV